MMYGAHGSLLLAMIDVPDAAPPTWSVSSLGNVIVLIWAWVMYLSFTICWST